MSNKEALRSGALRSRPAKSKTVDFEGQKYEVRAPSVRSRAQILRRAGVLDEKKKETDPGRMQVAAVIACTFDPESGERVFEEADFEALLEDPAGGVVDALAAPALEFLNTSNDKAGAKND